jgi:DNA-binding CsgD family transcriptional regulator
MAIKSYAEMRKIDVLPFCDKREAKDDKGRKIEVPYLNWAKCKELLHQNGAEVVYFEPCVNANGSSLFMSDQVFTDKNDNTNRCYEVRVKIVIDDLVFEAQYPLMNGSNPVKDNSMTQQRLWNAQTRAFVKGVAMRTGLGFGLWLDNMDDKEASGEEDLSKHNIYAIRERMQQAYTKLIKRGLSTSEIAQMMGTSEQTVQYYLNGIFDEINRFEKAMGAL